MLKSNNILMGVNVQTDSRFLSGRERESAMRAILLGFMGGMAMFICAVVIYMKEQHVHGDHYSTSRLRYVNKRVHMDVSDVHFVHTNIPAFESIGIGVASPLPPVWSLDKIVGTDTIIVSRTGEDVFAVTKSSACWGVPDGYKEFTSNPFVYRVKSTTVRYDGRVLFYDNATHVLGVGLDVCIEASGFPHARPYWDPVLGDFLRCRTRITAPEVFLGVYCKITDTLVLDLCPLGSQLQSSVCAVGEVVQRGNSD